MKPVAIQFLIMEQLELIVRSLKFEPFIRAADTYWRRVAMTQVTRALRNVDKIFLSTLRLLFLRNK